MESHVSASDFSPLDEILESMSAEEAVSTVLMDKDLDEGSDEVFSDETSEGKCKKRERTDVEIVSPVKKRQKILVLQR